MQGFQTDSTNDVLFFMSSRDVIMKQSLLSIHKLLGDKMNPTRFNSAEGDENPTPSPTVLA